MTVTADERAEARPDEVASGTGDGDDRRPMAIVLAGVAVSLSLLLGVGALFTGGDGFVDRGPSARQLAGLTAGAWLEAWASGDTAAMRELAVPPATGLEEQVAAFVAEVQPVSLDVEPGLVDVQGDDGATVAFTAELELAGLGPWRYEGRLDLARVDVPPGDDGGETEPTWRVAWAPTALHPALAPGRRLVRTRTWEPRAPILAVDGTPLTGDGAAPPRALAAHVLGRAGALDDAATGGTGGRHLPGDVAGLSGLEAGLDEQLGGSPSGTIEVWEGDTPVEVLRRFVGLPPQPVRTTFDVGVQAAAEAALGVAGKPAALVVVHAPTGEVRAAANRPIAGFDRAILGQYPPGSTFKVVTTTALLANGITPDTATTCPPTATVDGRRFRNAEGEALGDIPFRTAFFRSCNTAFVQLASELPDGTLQAAAEAYGFNADWALPVPGGSGSFPPSTSAVDHAAAAIGQARVTASPLQMAVVAGSVASGAYHPPRLVAADEPPSGEPLGAGTPETLRELMRLVVEQGTGTNARLPGEPVHGKTGTAEYGTASPPRTHAWFMGFRGDLAFAVLVEDGGFGGAVAAPIARAFLANLG